MKGLRGLVWLAVTMIPPAMGAQGRSHLETVLAEMDAASARFRSAEADFQWDFYERVTRSTSTQTGTIFFERQHGGTAPAATQMGAKIVQPDVKLLSYDKGVLEVFDPKANSLIRIAARGNQGQYESFLTLGFGGSGSELTRTWTVADQGMETLDGVPCAKLDLVSKDASVKAMFTHVVVWVDPSRGISLKQVFYTPSDDVRTAFYRNIRYNAKVEKKGYGFKVDKATNVVNR